MSLQSLLARNELASRNGRLQGPARKVGLSQPSQSQQSQQGGAAGGAQRILRRAVQQNSRDDDEDFFQDQELDQELDPNGERIDNPSRAGQAGDVDGAAEAGLDQ